MSCSKRRIVEEDDQDPSQSYNQTVCISSQQCARPEHFLLTVESFSLLFESELEKYESDEFEAGGYKWRLVLCPKENDEKNGSNHISLYLSISDSEKLPLGWEVNTRYTLFVYNHIFGMYHSFQAGTASGRRFHALKTEQGFSIDLDHFKESSNGFLFEDTCIFGADVFVNSSPAIKKQRLSLIKKSGSVLYKWKIANFSTAEDYLVSDNFKIGELDWELQLYPNGDGKSKGKALSVFLSIADESTLSSDWRAYLEFKIRVKNKLDSAYDVERPVKSWFNKLDSDWGIRDFITLTDLNDKTNGFIVDDDDTLKIEIEVTLAAMTKYFK